MPGPLSTRASRVPPFVPDHRPLYAIQFITGSGHTAENPGGIPGNWFDDAPGSNALFLSYAREGQFRRLLYKDVAGAKAGQNNPASTYYTALPQIRALFDSLDPTFEYWLYNGTRMSATAPSIYNLDIGSPDAVATPAFIEQANAPWLRLGITNFFNDASYIEIPDPIPGYNEQKQALLNWGDQHFARKYGRLRVGAELYSHTPSLTVPGQFDLLYPQISQRPHLCTYPIWKQFYSSTVLSVPSSLELHVLVYGPDILAPTSFNYTQYQLLRSRGFVVSFAHNFKDYSADALTLWNQMLPYIREDSARTPVNRIIRPSYGGSLEIRQ